MNLIQIVLSTLLLIIVATYFTRLRSQLRDRLLVLCMAIGVFALLLFPDVSTQVANLFGVGRGVDFLFYLAHAGSVFIAIILYSKVRQQSEQIAELTRQIALKTARFAPDDTHSN
jgi:hypothetical protein